MYNWNIDINQLKKSREKYEIWKLEQMVNFGLDGEKLEINLLKKYWGKLDLDPKRRKVLEFWIWEKQS
jgi:hypothetical protein